MRCLNQQLGLYGDWDCYANGSNTFEDSCKSSLFVESGLPGINVLLGVSDSWSDTGFQRNPRILFDVLVSAVFIECDVSELWTIRCPHPQIEMCFR